LLNQSVKDRLRTHLPVATTLSGGLDSTTVTISLLNHLPSVDAVSIVTEVFPEFDERQPFNLFYSIIPKLNGMKLTAIALGHSVNLGSSYL
jgi:asparagine synthase (glutamine-hydrolysing)